MRRAEEDEGRLVRIPANVGNDLRKILHEMADTDFSETDVAKKVRLSTLRIRNALSGYRVNNTISLEETAFLDDGETIESIVADPNPEPEYDDTSEQIDEALNLLPPLARRIVEKRFGLNGQNGECSTIEELAAELGTNHEKVRTIISKSLRILREQAPNLRSLLDH